MLATSIESDGSVLIDWTAPANNGDSISAYTIEIYDGSSYATETSSCDGSDATIISNSACTIPMSTLTAGSYFTLAANTDI